MNVNDNKSTQCDSSTAVKFASHKSNYVVYLIVANLQVVLKSTGLALAFLEYDQLKGVCTFKESP